MLTYDEFLEKARSFAGREENYPYSGTRNARFNKLRDDDACFAVRWRTGGSEGGTCWSTKHLRSIAPDPEPDFESLIDFLEECDVRLREARVILALSETDECTERGYYGNFEEFSYKWIPFDALYEKLVEFGYAEPRSEPSP